MMESLKEDLLNQESMMSSPESLRKFLESQKEVFHGQIHEFQSIVVTQCRLTGVNPLSQEMAAGAMSVNIGKRPRDLLNPKVVKYLQTIFSVKDTISKTECRDVSRNFRITVTQIREFFASQRTRVRKLVRQSREKAIVYKALEDAKQDAPPSSESPMPVDSAPLNSIAPNSVEEAPSCSTPNDELTNINDLDREFVDNIFALMRKEESFCGQEKLMRWILQIQNSSVLSWFLSKGGVMIIATWLSEATVEEQTSVLSVILEVLSHLPLHKALPAHVSAIMQSVNKLRFYRIPDVSNRAKALLSKWFKTFPRTQALKKPNGVKPFARRDRMLNQSAGEQMGDEVWRSHIGITEEILACSNENLEDARKMESPQALKLLPSSTDDPNKKHTLGLSSSQTRERRKIQLVEQPGQKAAGRSSQASRAASVSQSRPISVDDIQKAKMRALYMQNKYGKSGSSAHEANGTKMETTKKPVVTRTGNLPPVPEVCRFTKVEEQKSTAAAPHQVPGNSFPVPKKDSGEPIWWGKRAQIPWQMPPEFKLNDMWRVGCGDDSKEVEMQKNRNRREKETVYKTVQEIPLNPKEPWDREMDYDDSLTPEIPLEQLPDADVAEAQVVAASEDANRPTSATATTSSSLNNHAVSAEPDLELLAVLLKNPELVFALTSGQAAANLSNQDTVRLLDMIKAGGPGLFSNANGVNNGRKEEKIEVSLPSPTPSSNPGTGMSALDAVKNPFSRQGLAGSRSGYPRLAAATTTAVDKPAPTIPAQSQVSTSITPPRRLTNVSSLQHPTQAATLPFASLQTLVPEAQSQSLHRNTPSNSFDLLSRAAEGALSMKNASPSFSSFPNPSAAATYPSILPEKSANSLPPAQSSSSSPSPAPMTFPAQARQYHPQKSPIYTQPQAVKPLYHSSTSGKPSSVPSSYRDGLSFRDDHYTQADRPNLHAPYGGGLMQPHLQTCPPREREHYTGRNEFDSWSPENNLNRPGNTAGRNFLERRPDPGQSYQSDRSRQRDLPLYQDRDRDRDWDFDRHGKRWLKDRRH